MNDIIGFAQDEDINLDDIDKLEVFDSVPRHFIYPVSASNCDFGELKAGDITFPEYLILNLFLRDSLFYAMDDLSVSTTSSLLLCELASRHLSLGNIVSI